MSFVLNEAILMRIKLVAHLKVKKIKICLDSWLIVGQVNNAMEIKDERFKNYQDLVLIILVENGFVGDPTRTVHEKL